MLLLFDLDGTLTNSSTGIIRSVNHAFERLGHPEVSDADIRSLIGAPLAQIFQRVLGPLDGETIDRGVAAYRERFFEVGFRENEVYDGVPETLDDLLARGHRLQVVTAKPVASASRVLEHFGLAGYFEMVRGSAPDVHAFDKADLVRLALAEAGCPAGRTAMIGDRADDVRAGTANGVESVGVLWGYGLADELLAAGAAWLADAPADLIRVGEGASRPVTGEAGTRHS
ncbi:MAG: HAD hydrolase-like protein [Vicinamibacterales bacterium]